MHAEAAQVYPSAIQMALINQQYEYAHSMMLIFEQESGLFDEQGNIEYAREKYYYFYCCPLKLKHTSNTYPQCR